MSQEEKGQETQEAVEVIEKLAVIRTSESGRSSLELRRVKFYKSPIRLDLRPWFTRKDNPEQEYYGHGIRLSDEDARILYDTLGSYLAKATG